MRRMWIEEEHQGGASPMRNSQFPVSSFRFLVCYFRCRTSGGGARILLAVGMLTACAALAPGQDIASFEKRVTGKVMDNGLTVLVWGRHEGTVCEYFTYVVYGAGHDAYACDGIA